MITDNVVLVGVTLLALCALMAAGSVLMAILAAVTGVRVRELSIGVGPKLLQFRLGQTLMTLRLLPFSSYSQLSDNRYPELADDPAVSFDSRPPIVRFLILLAGVLVFFVPGFIAWGSGAFDFVRSAIPQLISGALSPMSEAQVLLQNYKELVAAEGFFKGFGAITIKLGVFYLIPWTPAAGLGQAIAGMRSKAFGRGVEIWATLTTLLLLAISASWVVALVRFCF